MKSRKDSKSLSKEQLRKLEYFKEIKNIKSDKIKKIEWYLENKPPHHG